MNRKCLLINIRSVIGRCSVKKGALKKFPKIHGKTPVLESLFKKVAGEQVPAILFKKKSDPGFFLGIL